MYVHLVTNERLAIKWILWSLTSRLAQTENYDLNAGTGSHQYLVTIRFVAFIFDAAAQLIERNGSQREQKPRKVLKQVEKQSNALFGVCCLF